MASKNIPCSKLKEMIKDEIKGSKEYKHYGLDKLANDEESHSQYLKKLHKKKCGKSNGTKV